jgi:hypothetical protein
MVNNHNIVLTSLTQGTIYYFEVISSGERSPVNPTEYYSFKTLAPTSYSIILEPVCGVCGDLVEVGFCNEVIGVTAAIAAAGTYHICWDSKAAGSVVGTFTATGAGVYTLTFFMPEAKKGIHNVYLTDNVYGEKAKAEFEVLPSVKIDPEEGPVGTKVTLNCYGFPDNKTIQIEFDDTIITKDTDKTNAVGSFPISYNIPDTPAGGYTFDIATKEGTVLVNWVSKYFKVIPKITVTPDSGIVGQAILVDGTGFASDEEGIKVTFDGETRKENIFADVDGSWSTSITVPIRTCSRYVIDASGMSTRARDVEDVMFTVVAGIVVTPDMAYVGEEIAVTGGGFAPGENGIKVYFDGTPVTAAFTADTHGCWESSFNLPASAYGSHTVGASGDTTKPAVTDTLSTKAKIEGISPDEGAPGDYVSLTGSGFSSNRKLTVTLGTKTAELGDVRTQTNGNFNFTFRVPKESPEGKQTVVVSDEGGATASTDFTVQKKILSTTPLPVSPRDSTLRSGKVTFHWQGAMGGAGYTYIMEISTTAGSGGILSKSGITVNSYTLTDDEALPKGTYYWRVKLVDDYGNESAWSDYIEFTVSPIPTWVWVVIGLVVLVVLMVVAYRETKFKVTE